MPKASTSDVPQRDEAAVTQFIERFASTLIESGFPRMVARVFVALLSGESTGMTAAELAQRLQASPAAISGAVRYLIQVDLISRQREPGSRRDYYVVEDDVWFHVIDRRLSAIAKWGDQLAVGVAAVGEASEAGARLQEMVEFFDFLREEMPALLRDWRKRRTQN